MKGFMVYNNSNFTELSSGSKRDNKEISTAFTDTDIDTKIKRVKVEISLFELVPELFGKIFSYISLAELNQINCVNKEFYKLLLSITILGAYHLISNPKSFKEKVGSLEIQNLNRFQRFLFRFALANPDVDRRLKDGSMLKEFLNPKFIKLSAPFLPTIQLYSSYQVEDIEKSLDEYIIKDNLKIAINVNAVNLNIKALRACINDLKEGKGFNTDDPKVIDFYARSIQMGVTIKDRILETTKKSKKQTEIFRISTLQEIFSDHIDIVHKKLCDVKSKIAQEQDENKAHSLSDLADSLLNLLLTFKPKESKEGLSSYRKMVNPEIVSRREKGNITQKIILSAIKNPHISYSGTNEFRLSPDLWEIREFLLCALEKEGKLIEKVPMSLLKRRFIALKIVKLNSDHFSALPTSLKLDKVFRKACFECNSNVISYFSIDEKIQYLKKDPTLILEALTSANKGLSDDVHIILNSYLKDNKNGLKCFVIRKNEIYFEIKKDGEDVSLCCNNIMSSLLERYNSYLKYFSDEFQKEWIAKEQKFYNSYNRFYY